jgi:hypothetical protein
MEQLPLFIPIVFILSIVLAMYFLYKALGGFSKFMYILSVWLLIQALLGQSGFYYMHGSGSPRFLLLILPPLIFIVLKMSTSRGRYLTGKPDLKWLMLVHILRIPVELVLFWLFLHRAIPRIMTFEGRNLDVLAGITAPLIYYFGYVKNQLPLRVILTWNFISLVLLLNIVVIAVLSMPFPIQQFGFEQPDIALFYFPFVWLPGCLVPMVIFAHVFTIHQMLNRSATTDKS